MNPEIEQHLNRAEELLVVAQELLIGNHAADSVSRSYYAIFHAATAVLKSLGIERKSHHALWASFGEQVAKQGLMDIKYHRYALLLFTARISSDYQPLPEESIENAKDNLEIAKEFVLASKSYLEKQE